MHLVGGLPRVHGFGVLLGAYMHIVDGRCICTQRNDVRAWMGARPAGRIACFEIYGIFALHR